MNQRWVAIHNCASVQFTYIIICTVSGISAEHCSAHAVERGQRPAWRIPVCCNPVSLCKIQVCNIQCTRSQSIEVKCVFNICAVCLVAAGVRILVMMRHKLLATKLLGAVLVGNNMGNMVMMMKMGWGNTCVTKQWQRTYTRGCATPSPQPTLSLLQM